MNGRNDVRIYGVDIRFKAIARFLLTGRPNRAWLLAGRVSRVGSALRTGEINFDARLPAKKPGTRRMCRFRRLSGDIAQADQLGLVPPVFDAGILAGIYDP